MVSHNVVVNTVNTRTAGAIQRMSSMTARLGKAAWQLPCLQIAAGGARSFEQQHVFVSLYSPARLRVRPTLYLHATPSPRHAP
jgi:hypothetical protein